ncbi:MAG: glycosyltransferase family 1 protein [bacterium]|nr:glycosyltransferase family 1 protein [bacterium]
MKNKKIGIDARLYDQTGVGTYIRNLLHYLSLSPPDSLQYYVYALPEDVSRINLPPNKFIVRPVDAKWHSFAEQTTFYSALMKDNLDLMHFTYFSYPVAYSRPFMATIHDMTPLLHKTGQASTHNPLWYELKHRIFTYVLSSQIKHARAIITPTKAVKEQIVSWYGQSIENKIHPIYEGVHYELMTATENTSLAKKYPKPFYLYVGNFYPHKNVERLIEAWQDISVNLLLVGPDNMFSQKLKDSIETKKITNISFNHTATTEDLVFFYKHASALVNPSLSEGFGLPLIEAAYFNCPVIASDIPVFKELLGDGYSAFDPISIEDIHQKIKLQNSNVKTSKNQLLEKFSFEKMTQEIVTLYEKLG